MPFLMDRLTFSDMLRLFGFPCQFSHLASDAALVGGQEHAFARTGLLSH